jgi:hypothetical protein
MAVRRDHTVEINIFSHASYAADNKRRYYVDSPLVQDSICLADVPGTKDINMYRVTAATAYLQQCEMTIVVVDIKRATSDQSFRQHYLDAHNRRHHGSVILLATRADVSAPVVSFVILMLTSCLVGTK